MHGLSTRPICVTCIAKDRTARGLGLVAVSHAPLAIDRPLFAFRMTTHDFCIALTDQ